MSSMWPSHYEPGVQIELFRLGYRNNIANGIGGLLLALILVVMAWGITPRENILAWAALATTSNLWTWLLAWFFRKLYREAHPSLTTLRTWQWHYTVFLLCMGVVWSSVGFLFAPQNFTLNLAVTTAFVGAAGFSAASNGPANFPAFMLSLLLADLLMGFLFQRAFESITLYVVLMLILYSGVLILVGYNAHRQLVETVRLRLTNERLVNEKAAAASAAEQANREKSLFLAAASHDLRQPVHALLLLVDALKQSAMRPEQNQLVGYIQQAGLSIGKLFSALMELSRLESGAEKAELGEVFLVDRVRNVVQRKALEAQQKGLKLRWAVSRPAETLVVQTDGVLLERILENFLSNALRYTERGEILVTLRYRASRGLAELAVFDTGIGIAQGDLQRIFDPYVQIGNAERDRSKGLGLGLAIVRRTVELLGFSLTVRSQLGRGTCFSLQIPNAELVRVRAVRTGNQDKLEVTGLLAQRRILVVDDDPMVLQAMHTIMAAWQVDLRSAANWEDCMANLAQAQQVGWVPECILSDFRLPGAHNGIELLNQLVERYPGAIGVLQTGEQAVQVRVDAEDAGYIVLTKPVPADLLYRTLAALLPQPQTSNKS